MRSYTGPYLEFLGVGSFVLILVLFILIGREELSDRIIGLFGHRHVSLTTRTMQEIGQRISRYLATFAMVNSGFGLVIGLGLWLIGVPFAVLWGCLAAMLRFIPYVGPAVAFILPLVFSFAHFPGWVKPLEVVALFAVVEAALTSFLEPIIYGKTTGVSALGLLVAAMFWTWLWGTLGLLLSTPMTVCLAVLGKYVPSLWFFATLLNEDPELEPEVRLYQRLVALDREGAVGDRRGGAEAAAAGRGLRRSPGAGLIAGRTRRRRDELDEATLAFARDVIGDILDTLDATPDFSLESLASSAAAESGSAEGTPSSASVQIVGLVADDASDALVLRMLGQLLAPSGCDLEIIADTDTSLQALERVAEHSPALVVVSHLPPEGTTLARYLVRRLRAQFSDLPIVVGRWDRSSSSTSAAEQLKEIGASRVVSTLADARALIQGQVASEQKKMPVSV